MPAVSPQVANARALVRTQHLPRTIEKMFELVCAQAGYLRQMDLWGKALALATEARDDIDKMGASMTPDQKLATARIYATLAVAQELAGDSPAAPESNVRGAAVAAAD